MSQVIKDFHKNLKSSLLFLGLQILSSRACIQYTDTGLVDCRSNQSNQIFTGLSHPISKQKHKTNFIKNKYFRPSFVRQYYQWVSGLLWHNPFRSTIFAPRGWLGTSQSQLGEPPHSHKQPHLFLLHILHVVSIFICC